MKKSHPNAKALKSVAARNSMTASKVFGTLYNKNNKKSSLTQLAPQVNTLSVFDEEGNDVTPLPLNSAFYQQLAQNNNTQKKKGMDMNSSQANFMKSAVLDVLTSMDQAGSTYQSMMGKSAIDNIMTSKSQAQGNEHDSFHKQASVDDFQRGPSDTSRKYFLETKVHPVKPVDPNEYLTVTLTETEDICLFDFPSICVLPEDIEESQKVKQENERYLKLKENRVYSDNYVNQGTQGHAYTQKTKEIQTTPIEKQTVDCWSNDWIIHDAYTELMEDDKEDVLLDDEREESKDTLNDPDDLESTESSLYTGSQMETSGYSTSVASSNMSSVNISQNNFSVSNQMGTSMTMSMSGLPGRNASSLKSLTESKPAIEAKLFKALNKESLAKSLFMMERAIMSNIYEPLQFVYRGLEFRDESMDEQGLRIPSMKLLWSFRCEMSRGRQVTCLTWNKQNKDILAVGYSSIKDSNINDGLVLCFTLKNPDWPERVYNLHSPVCSLDFSTATPNVLAVGMRNGSISLYDIRSKKNAPVLENRAMIGRHRDSVWELRWVADDSLQTDTDSTAAEVLVSVSSDGRVIQWSVLKGWEYRDIMVIKMSKETEKRDGAEKKVQDKNKNSLLNRVAGGLSIDFSSKDNSLYLLSTDEGLIYSCSRSYNEQYLAVYSGHSAPVYKVRWCPLCPNIFLSCSGDWTMKLWSETETDRPLLTFQSEKAVILDIAWSPVVSTVFGSVNATGSFELWDLQYSTLDPAIKHQLHEKYTTSVTFARDVPIVLLGDQSGFTSVYRLDHIPSYTKFQRDLMTLSFPEGGEESNLSEETIMSMMKEKQAGLLLNLISGNQTNLN